jgi:site-specific DNA-methyltransferase (adenine-specific)
MLELNKIYCGDCLELMKQIPDKSIDLVLTDPPYGISQKSGGFRGKELNFGSWDKLSEKELQDIILQIIRVSKGSIFVFCSAEQLSYIIKEFSNNDLLIRQLIWYKPSAFSMNADKMYMWSTENIVWAKQRKALFNPRLKRNLFICNTESERYHPTQKPLDLIKEFILDSTKEDMVVLDPFMGSGTTAVACKQLKRNFIGIEISQKYCDIANQRLRQNILI